MRWYNSTNKKHLYLLPGLLFVFIFVVYGLLQTIRESFTTPSEKTLTLVNYTRLFEQLSFWDSFVFSLRVSIISTVISLAIGLIVTKLLHEFFLKKYWKIIVWVPMVFPHFIAGYLILLLFAPSGLFSTLVNQIGLIDGMSKFPIIVMDRQGVGIILTYIWKETPFVILMLLPVYAQIDNRYKDVVATLGGGKWETFRTVEWPWLFPVVVETGLIVFAFVFAAFEVPYLLGATYPKMLPVQAYQWFFDGDWSNRPLAMTSMLLITAMIMILAAIFFYLLQKRRYRMMRGN